MERPCSITSGGLHHAAVWGMRSSLPATLSHNLLRWYIDERVLHGKTERILTRLRVEVDHVVRPLLLHLPEVHLVVAGRGEDGAALLRGGLQGIWTAGGQRGLRDVVRAAKAPSQVCRAGAARRNLWGLREALYRYKRKRHIRRIPHCLPTAAHWSQGELA